MRGYTFQNNEGKEKLHFPKWGSRALRHPKEFGRGGVGGGGGGGLVRGDTPRLFWGDFPVLTHSPEYFQELSSRV